MNSLQAARRLAPRCTPDELRHGFALRWARLRGLELGGLLPGAEPVCERLAAWSVEPSLKELERVSERLIGAARRRAQGATYTPDEIIDHLLEAGLALAAPEGVPSFCDPACGAGGFLLRAARLLEQRWGVPPELAFERYIVGIDNDPAALEAARLLIRLSLLERGRPAVEPRLLALDTLLEAPDALLARAGWPEGFDLLATNPPYVKIQSLEAGYRARVAAAFPGLARGSFGLAPLFLVRGLELLRPRGALAVITQNNLGTSLAGEPVRRLLQERGALRRIVDFGHQAVFEDVSAYTCLVFLTREARPSFEFGMCAKTHTLEALRAVELAELQTARLDPRKWRLAAPRHLANLARIEATGTPLGRLASVRVGFATLADPVFLARAVGEAAAPLADPSARLELAITRPACKVADLREGSGVFAHGLRVLFPYRRAGGRWVPIPEDELRSEFPLAWAWLLAHRPALAARDKGRKDYGAWYAWGRTQSMDAPGPKLLTKTFSRGPAFFLDPTDQLFCNGYAVRLERAPSASPGLTLPLLQRVLNSRVMDYHARLTSFQIQGDYQCFQKNFIARFGVPDLDAAEGADWLALPPEELDRALLARYGLAASEVEEIVGPLAR